MPAACGMACEICDIREKGICEGCVPGTDPKAPARVEMLKAKGLPCPVLECAVKSKVDYCLRCEKFPCDVHYNEFPYSNKLLDRYKEMLKK